MEFYIRWRGQVTGPFSTDRVRSLLKTGQITRHHQVSADGTSWQNIGDEPEFSEMRPSSPVAATAGIAHAVPSAKTDGDRLKTRVRLQPSQEPEAVVRRWFYYRGDEVLGPASAAELQAMLDGGQLNMSTQVCQEGERNWSPLREALAASGAMTAGVASSNTLLPCPASVLAPFWKRFFAAVLDLFVVLAATGLACTPVAGLMLILKSLGNPLPLAIAAAVLGIVVAWTYFTCLESSSSRASLGKTAMALTVVGADNETITYAMANARFWGKAASVLTLGVGFFMAAFTAHRQALHDKMAKTWVIDIGRPADKDAQTRR